MFTFQVERYVPKFLLNDKNGYALAKAIEAAMQIVNDTIYDGLNNVFDYDTMPEWRLDELAWEYDLVYDFGADTDTKRQWIKNAVRFYRIHGTPAGIIQYLQAKFDSVVLEEYWQYSGDPYHFRVIVDGEWTDENDEWAKKSVAMVKNVRSVLDNIIFNAGTSELTFQVGAAVSGIELEIPSQTIDL